MNPEILAAVVAVALVVVGVCGIVVPVLPGSLAILAGLFVWALWGSTPAAWVLFGVGGLFVAAGMSAQYVVTGRQLKKRSIPSRSVVVGLVAGVIGMFVIPFLGLPLGFAAGLLASEFARVRDVNKAVATSWAALKSVGLGVLIELGCGLAAAMTLVASLIWGFTS